MVFKFLEIGAAVASIFSLLLAIYFALNNAELQRDGAIVILILFLIITSWLHRVSASTSDGIHEFLSDEVTIALDIDREYEIFYQRPFIRIPYLKLYCVKGGINFEITEQRSDGFKFKTRGMNSWGAPELKIRFTAKGKFL